MTDQTLWASMTSWFTPTTLFLIVNLVIGIIAVTSRFTSNRKPRHQYDHLLHHDSPAQLVRAPSLLVRVKSFNFSLYKFPNSSPAQEQDQDQHFFQQHTEAAYNTNAVETYQPQPQLARVPSFLERIKSINFSSVYRSQHTYPEAETEVVNNPETETKEKHQAKRSKSETKKSTKTAREGVKKSGSETSINVETEEEMEMVERRRPQTTRLKRTESVGDGDVDAKADDFINKFKKQLRLQRLDSLLRYKDMFKER